MFPAAQKPLEFIAKRDQKSGDDVIFIFLIQPVQDLLEMNLNFFSVFQMPGIFYVAYNSRKGMNSIHMIHVSPSYTQSI